jgi:hypothetical protein
MSQFTGNLKNIQVNLIEASPNLIKKQQERLLADLKGPKINMFLTYDMEMHQKQRKDQKEEDAGLKVERFYNKDQNFSITWWPSLKDYYNHYV